MNTKPNSPRSTPSRARTADLLREIVRARTDLIELTDQFFPARSPTGAPSFRRLADWYAKPANAETIARLRRLLDERADIAFTHARATAALRLAELASGVDRADSARKACYDILRLAPIVSASRAGRVAPAEEKPRAPVEGPPTDDDYELGHAILEKLAAMSPPPPEESEPSSTTLHDESRDARDGDRS